MKSPVSSSFFFYPADERGLVLSRFGEIHYARMRYLVPAMLVVIAYLIVTDLLGTEAAAVFKFYDWYLRSDLAFGLVQLPFLARLYRPGRRPGASGLDRRAVFIYCLLVLTWAAAITALEFRQNGSITTIVIAIMAVAMLALFSFFSMCALIGAGMAAFWGACLLFPGQGPSGDRLIFLFSLGVVSILISRALFSAFVGNIVTTHRLAEANRELHAAQLSLIRNEKLATIGQLSAGLAHEINNPLGFIKSNVSALEQGFRYLRARSSGPAADAAQAGFFDQIEKLFDDTHDGFRRISEVIENLRYFAYEQPGGAFGPFDLNQGIEKSLAIARHRYRGIARVETYFGQLPLIEARGSEIDQVLLNIIINAIKAIESEPGKKEGLIAVTTRAGDSELSCEIADSGPGVSEELRSRIFDPFFTTKAAGEGLGLGLSLSYEIIVNRHGGSLTLLDGKPTTFRITLPIHQEKRK